jgi:hypothetical protein
MKKHVSTYNYQTFDSESAIQINTIKLLFEGSITNLTDLRLQLDSNGDSTVIIALAYQKWGSSFINQLEGCFFIALFDEHKKLLLLYRDRFGIVPCYYHKTDHFFACSSEIGQLLQLPNFKSKIDIEGLGDYLSYGFVHAPKTLVSGVSQLLPGHYLKLTDDEVSIHTYWSANDNFDYTIDGRTEEQHEFHINRIQDEIKKPNQFLEEELSKLPTPENILNLVGLIDHPTPFSIRYLLGSEQSIDQIQSIGSSVGYAVLLGEGSVYQVLESFQEHRWLLSYPKSLRRVISNWLKIPFKGELSATYQQLIQQDYYDLDYLYPTYNRLYPIAPLQQSLGGVIEDMQKEIAQSTVVYQTEGFTFPYLAKVGLLEMQTKVANAQLPALFQATKNRPHWIEFPFLSSKLQRYLLHLPDVHKAALRQKLKSPIIDIDNPHILLTALSEETKSEILIRFQNRSFVNGQFKVDVEKRFDRLTVVKSKQLLESILILELWLTENKIDE